MTEAPPYSPTPESAPQQTDEKSTNIILWLIVGILGALFLLFLLILFAGNAEETTPPPPPPVVEPAPPAGGTTATVTATTEINVRSGPGTNYPVYGVAPIGASAEATGVSSDGQWWQVKVPASLDPSERAWVSANYTNASNTGSVPVVQPPTPPPPVDVPPPPEGAPTATATETINIRSGPGTNYPSYGLGFPGDTGEVLGISEDGQWYVVRIPTSLASDGFGWVSASYVVTENAENVPVIPNP